MADNRKNHNRKKQEKFVEPGRRIMDLAYLRDGNSFHTGEALVLACLLHAKGKTFRGEQELKQVGKMLNDPNIDKPRSKK